MSQNNKEQNKLLQLRCKIDEIDESLINLINQRIAVVKEVGKFKEEKGDKFFVKSAREADMIKDLIKKADAKIPQSMIVSIWRKMITCANVLEQDLQIALFNPAKIPDYQYLIREYYADFAPLKTFENLPELMQEIKSGKVQIAVFSLGDKNWWQNFPNELKIYAAIPFIGEPKQKLVVAAIKEPEKSQEDFTLAVVKDAGDFEILQQDCDEFLVKIDGFFETLPDAKVIGHFAKPILF